MRTNAIVSVPLPRVLANAFFPYTAFVFAVALLFGGGARQGLWSDAVVELVALPLLAWSLFRLAPGELDRSAQVGIVVLGAIVALPLLQLIPLPPALWTWLPDRNVIAAGYNAAAIVLPWLPVSLDPAATLRSLLALIPGAALFLAMLSLHQWERRRLVALVLSIVFIDVWIGIIQIMGGANLYFYAITNEGMAVGFFANGNHNAAFVACAIPFVAAWALGLLQEREKYRGAITVMAVLLVMLVVGVAVIGSRAGLGLGFVAGVMSIAMGFRIGLRSGRHMLPVAMAGFAIAVLIAVQFGLAGWEKRNVQDRDIMSDLRWPVAAVTLRAAEKYLPFGTGFGTFVPIYQMSAPRTDVTERYVNHAHNDWLELLLEGGVPALAVLIGFLVWFAAVGIRAWRRETPTGLDRSFACAGSIAIVLLIVHSVVDYPLRSIAIMTVFALSCGLLIPPVGAEARSEADGA